VSRGSQGETERDAGVSEHGAPIAGEEELPSGFVAIRAGKAKIIKIENEAAIDWDCTDPCIYEFCVSGQTWRSEKENRKRKSDAARRRECGVAKGLAS
jgi:hypothetical protein